MMVREAMTTVVLTIGPSHSLRAAAGLMARRQVGAAVVADFDGQGPGILTERDVLESLAAGQNPDAELAGDHLTRDVVFADPDWPLEDAASAMLRGGFRHLVVLDGVELAGMISMRDIVRSWAQSRHSMATIQL